MDWVQSCYYSFKPTYLIVEQWHLVFAQHTTFDASSISLFLNNRADVARRKIDIIQRIINIAPIFNYREGIPTNASPLENPTKKLVTKRFVFDECNIAALKNKCSSSSYIRNSSQVESIIALLWMCAMNNVSLRKNGVKPTKSVANIAMNLRGRMIPPLSSNYVGYLATSSMETSTIESYPKLLQFLIGQIRKAISKLDNNCLKKFQFRDGIVEHIHSIIEVFELHSKNELEAYSFLSWCRFRFYETDFGWGSPTWASPLFNVENVIMLMDTKYGKGVEARVSLVEEDMVNFEREPELIAFTSDDLEF